MNWLSDFVRQQQSRRPVNTSIFRLFHLDGGLLFALAILACVGLFILYSASNQDIAVLERQLVRFGLAFLLMFVLAQIPPDKYRYWSPWLYGFSLILLLAVLVVGHTGHGAQRWINLGFVRFQPSELMKLSLPMMLAWFFHNKELPPSLGSLTIAGLIIVVPALLIAKQPDLGTAVLITGAGFCVLLLAGMRWRLIFILTALTVAVMPLAWHVLHQYQRQRVLTFLNPERDPLGSGYHIIQSKIAIGSGGLFGKGWLHGTQSHLQFLPEHATDFIFAVSGEELGLIGSVALIILFTVIVMRALYIANQAQDTFSRLLTGSIALTFFLSMFINVGMVTGLLPVVGVPLPLVSYGGTSMVTLLAGFGILMSIQTHRRLLSR